MIFQFKREGLVVEATCRRGLLDRRIGKAKEKSVNWIKAIKKTKPQAIFLINFLGNLLIPPIVRRANAGRIGKINLGSLLGHRVNAIYGIIIQDKRNINILRLLSKIKKDANPPRKTKNKNGKTML